MTHRRLSLFAALSLALASCAVAIDRVIVSLRRFADLMLAVLGRPEPMLAGNGGFTGLLVGHGPAYDSPPQHFLRHEAGTPQRGAHRHI